MDFASSTRTRWKGIVSKSPVVPQRPNDEVGKSDQSWQDSSDVVEDERSNKILVSGVQACVGEDYLELFFEKNGGSINSVEIDREENTALIEFEDPDVARRVASRNHKLEEVDLRVSLYNPSKQRPNYGNRLIIKGVNVSTTKDCLFNFLEAKSGASPIQLVYGEQEETVMVTFDSEPDYKRLADACRKRPVENSYLTVSKVCMSNCIIISNLRPSTSSDTVQFYFENKRRSKGGDVEKVKMLEESGTCLVYFQDYTVVDDVLHQKHKLGGQDLTVQVYIEKLGRIQGDGSEPSLKIPDAITIDDIEEKIVDFMKLSDNEAVQKQLEGCNAKVLWPEKGSSIVVKCEITAKTPDNRKLIKDWKANVEKNIKGYVKLLSMKEHPVWDEAWEAVVRGVCDISVEGPDRRALFLDKKEKVIRVVGYSHTVAAFSKTIEEVIKKNTRDIEIRKQTIRQTISNIKPIYLRMLLESQYPVKMEERFVNLKVKVNQNKNELYFEGVVADIQSAKVDLYENMNSFAVKVKENVSRNCIDLYQAKPVRDYIIKKLKSGKLVAVWEATDSKLAVCSVEAQLKSCMEFITDAVQEKTLSVNKASASILTSQKWQERLKEIYDTNSGLCKVIVKEDFSKVYITATSDIVDELTGAVESLLDHYIILNETFKLGNESIAKLIQNQHSNKLADIAKDLTLHYVQIHCDSTGILVQGTKNGIRLAREQLARLALQVQRKEHSLNRPGLAFYLDSGRGQDIVKSVEDCYPVVIKLDSDGKKDKHLRAFVSEASSQVLELGLELHGIGEAYYDERPIYAPERSAGGPGKVLASRGAFGGKPSTKIEPFRHGTEDPNVVRFIFYSLSMKSINDAITRLEKLIDQDLLDKVMKDSIIEKLTPDQVRELRAMANGQQIQLEVQQNQGYLKIAGISKNVMDFTDKAEKFLRGIERFELEKNHADMLKNIVQWFYIEITEVGQNLVKYTPLLNYSIEKAFKDQQPSHQFKDTKGDAYIVDFAAMEEYPVYDKEDTVKVIRRDLIKDSAVEVPTTWTSMNKTENLKVVTLQPSDSEYTTVVNLFNTTSGGNFTITKVDRIQNLTLYQQYQARKKLLDQQNKPGTQNERTLWHGAAPEAVDSINAHGFNRSYCGKNFTAFGDGVFFAVAASYSCQPQYSRPDPNGIKRMYLSKVLTGEFIMGKHGMRVPPQKPSGAASHALYDSVVNNVQNPSMFIIFNDTQAYPDYLVAFK